MKVFISIDIEGVCGVTSHQQIGPGGVEWEQARNWMTREAVAAAAEACREAGADEVIVADGHGMANLNLRVDAFPDYVRLVRGWPRPLMQMEGVLEPGVECCLMLGHHAGATEADGLLGHTYNGLVLRDVRLNGVSASETMFNAAVAGEAGLPVVAVSGDDAYVRQTLAFLPDVETVVTKSAIGLFSALLDTPGRVEAALRSAVARGVARRTEIAPFTVRAPLTLEIEFKSRAAAEMFSWLPGFRRAGPHGVAADFATTADAMRAAAFAVFYAPNFAG